MARPLKTVDESKIIELAAKGHTLKGIAAMLGISYKTLHRRFVPACEKGHELRNDAIRAKQMERALAGSDTMLIWLGKQYLDQADKKEISADVRRHESLMVVNIAAEKIKGLCDGYLPQQPKELPESTSDEASQPEQKGPLDESEKCESGMTVRTHQSQN